MTTREMKTIFTNQKVRKKCKGCGARKSIGSLMIVNKTFRNRVGYYFVCGAKCMGFTLTEKYPRASFYEPYISSDKEAEYFNQWE